MLLSLTISASTSLSVLPPSSLSQLLASVLGNDHVSVALLRPFHVSLGDLGEVEFPATWNMGDKEPTVRDQLIVRIASFLATHV